jgi:glycosyltransferase involved in cell wall biosynthesis
MKVNIILQFKMRWIEGFERAFGNRGWDFETLNSPFQESRLPNRERTAPDVNLFMWCDTNALRFINSNKPVAKNIVFIRRFEYYTAAIGRMRWDRVDKVIMVNHHLAEGFKSRTGVEAEVIFNGIIPDNWTYKERGHGKNIGLIGFVNYKKNFPLAVQILNKLPGHTLHVAGAVQDGAVSEYLNEIILNLGLKDRVKYYGHVDNMDEWLEDKDYILSTSLTEGNPNNIIEAMAKGIKPVVHAWPGSQKQFPNVFASVEQALYQFHPDSTYDSKFYRNLATTRFGEQRFEDVADIIEEITQGDQDALQRQEEKEKKQGKA